MKYCPECGTKVNENQKFCSECATPLKQMEDTVALFEDKPKTEDTVAIFGDKQETEKTVGIFADEPKTEKTVGIFEEKKPVDKNEKPEKKATGGKAKLALIVAGAITVVGILGYFSFKEGGFLGDITDAAVYDENDTSANIVLEKEIPDPASLSYYDFAVTNCPNNGDMAWETVESIQGHKPLYQVNEAEVAEPYIMVEVDVQMGSRQNTKEEFNTILRILKDRLDVLETPYAVRYEKNGIGDYSSVYIKVGTERMGDPIFKMLTYRNDGYHHTIPTLSSQKGDYNLFDAKDFSFKKRISGEYDMFVSTKGTTVEQENHYNEFLDYLNSHIGEKMYWVYSGLATARFTIDKKVISNFEKTGEFRFSEICFLNNRKPMKEESYLLKLLYVSLMGESYPAEIDISSDHSIEFSEGANEMDLGYHINTAADEQLRNAVTTLYPDSYCYRPAVSVIGSSFNIDIMYDEAEFSDLEFAKLVKEIYEKSPEISGGGYQDVYIYAKTSSPDRDYLKEETYVCFRKEPDGKISLSYSEYKASDEYKNFMETDPLFTELKNN